MKSWWKVAFGILCGLLGGGLIYLVSSPPRGAPVQLLPPPSPAPIQVYVTGAVIHPGVYALPAGSRIEQAIQAAGGAAAQADLQAVNLAEMLEDGRPAADPDQGCRCRRRFPPALRFRQPIRQPKFPIGRPPPQQLLSRSILILPQWKN